MSATSYVTGVDEDAGEEWRGKKEALEERWAEKVKTRANAKQAKQASREDQRDPSQNISAFHQNFKAGIKSVESKLEDAREKVTSESLLRADFTKVLDELKVATKALQRDVAEAALYIPSYDLQQCSKQIEALNKRIETSRTSLAPRRKFAFGKKKLEKAKNVLSKEKPTVQSVVPETTESTLTPSNELVYEGHASETIVIRKIERDQDLRLCKMKGCTIWILDAVGALRCVGLEDCKVFAGPVSGSCFIESSKSCDFHVAARQVRIHDTFTCRFLLNVCSRPIIENCRELQFGQYKLRFPALDKLLERHGLLHNVNLWDKVDDFKWLRQQHSPNWELLPEADNVQVFAPDDIASTP